MSTLSNALDDWEYVYKAEALTDQSAMLILNCALTKVIQLRLLTVTCSLNVLHSMETPMEGLSAKHDDKI